MGSSYEFQHTRPSRIRSSSEFVAVRFMSGTTPF